MDGRSVPPVASASHASFRASSLGTPPTVARGIEKHAPLGKNALALLRRATDHDKDGFSASFAAPRT